MLLSSEECFCVYLCQVSGMLDLNVEGGGTYSL
jgi:hypothetical protein